MINWDFLVLGPNVAIFGEPVAYVSMTGGPMTITGIYDEAYIELKPMGGHMGLEPMDVGGMGDTNAQRPILGVQLAQFTAPPEQGDSLSVRGMNFLVAEVQSDSHGGAKLLLNKA